MTSNMTPLEALAATTEGLFNSLAGWTGVSSANAPSDSRPSTSAPLPGSKILLFIRHGQGHHNPRDNLFSLEWVYHTLLTRDSDLTPKGVAQAHEARRQLLESDSLGEVEVVFVSPLSRAIATADLIFSGRGGGGRGGYAGCGNARAAAPPLCRAHGAEVVPVRRRLAQRGAAAATPVPRVAAVAGWCGRASRALVAGHEL